ncbi:hypothetical protein C4K35_2623 [Pseudomonas chlororaphis subsp. piscium]|nr:hypothetical protein C4K35_2623 [Pseudomonas chlororaphis subsp. piscium]AZC56784.1 hypothetical protein C4K34_2619 [Pseudomonas chlororaphis subsp. piscium]AZC75419.1 hypothetical protein C4K31_2516 [Pseudomonas chlororaphis subsp. piscium]AZC88896.1 hypothetical protein C4K29_2595 [Pseudomonas chlororaphis subsp. piscium]
MENGQQGTGSVLFALQYAVNQRQVKRVIRHKRTSASRTPPPHSGSRPESSAAAPDHVTEAWILGRHSCSPAKCLGAPGPGHPGSLPITIARRLHPGDPSCPESDLVVWTAGPPQFQKLKQGQPSPQVHRLCARPAHCCSTAKAADRRCPAQTSIPSD